MRIQLFKNNKGLIHGSDSMSIGCEKEGILRISSTEIEIFSECDSVVPLLCNGCTGEYKAFFSDRDGTTYDLGKVSLKGGRIQSPSPIAVEMMELRCRIEALEEEDKIKSKKIEYLSNIFDTNALNFLIK